MQSLKKHTNISFPNLLIGLDVSDDAAVFKINETQSIVQTLDFFTAIVDNPYDFAQVAAANALSDVYAMGGKPLVALNILCVPQNIPKQILNDLLQGGADKVQEAGAVIAGGHSIYDKNVKYGLSVTGEIHPNHILTKAAARAGDILVITKPLGTGVILSAYRRKKCSPESLSNALESMKKLNKTASEIFNESDIRCCTDVTGFGLAGHAQEIAEKSDVCLKIFSEKLPFLNEAESLAAQAKHSIDGLNRNRKGFRGTLKDRISSVWQALIFSPETSGGLLATVPEKEIEPLIKRFQAKGETLSIIGEVTAKSSALGRVEIS